MSGLADESEMAIQTNALTKRYGGVTALSECDVAVPVGRVSALVGPNGAGKTTLLTLLAGLSHPSGGSLQVVGQSPSQSPDFLAHIGFVAQEMPLWRRMTAAEHVHIGAHLNPKWDTEGAMQRLHAAKVPIDRPVQTLSGGQRAQVALALALAKRPNVLLLDEPVAPLDPLARRQFLGSLTEAVATDPVTVLVSSHLIADLERVCDHLILLSASRVQLCDEIDAILATHRLLVGPRRDSHHLPADQRVVEITHTPRQTTALVRIDGPVLDPAWEVIEPTLEEIVLAYMAQGESSEPSAALTLAGGGR
jgi:ABC-2 type transport system ATP-binding protein